jgi:hypothetical protein
MAKAARRRLAWVVVGVLAGVLGAVAVDAQPSRAVADVPSARVAAPHVRGLGTGAYDGAVLLSEAQEACPTVRRLLETLQQTDVMVIVGIGDRVLNRTGHLTFMGTGHGNRWLRITLERGNRRLEQIAWLAHELQHAAEVAGAPEVRDADGLRQLYARVGTNLGDGLFETDAAAEVGRQALREAYETAGKAVGQKASLE